MGDPIFYLDPFTASLFRQTEADLERARAENEQLRSLLESARAWIVGLRERYEPGPLKYEREQERAASLAADRRKVREMMVAAEGKPVPHTFRADRPRWFHQ
jgi:hypothetical protein